MQIHNCIYFIFYIKFVYKNYQYSLHSMSKKIPIAQDKSNSIYIAKKRVPV